jgi:hypothetical protein
MGSASAVVAVRVVDGAATATVNCPVAAAALVTLIASGFGEHVTPAGNPAAGQVTFTVSVNPPVGVTVIVEVPEAPAVTVTALPPTVKLPGLVTVTLTAVAVDVV